MDLSRPFIIAFIAVALLLQSCTKNDIFEKNLEVEKAAWRYDQPMQFEVLIEDTLSLYNLFLNVRHTDRYSWSNLWVLLETEYPDGRTFKQRAEIQMAKSTGEWLGNCTGDVCFLRQLSGTDLRFPRAGKYRFTLVQDMREEPVQGLLDVGMRLEKTEKPI